MMLYMRSRQAETNCLVNVSQKTKRAPKSKDLKQLKQIKLTAINSSSMGVNLGSKPKGQGNQNCAERLFIEVLEQGGHSTTDSERLISEPQSTEEVVLELETNPRSPKAAKGLDSGDQFLQFDS